MEKKGNPQLENGHTRIANELLEALMKTYLSNYERRVLDCIIRYTYGFQRKTHKLSLTFIAKATGIPLRHVWRAKKKLLEKNIVTQIGNKELGLQKKYKEWNIPQIGNFPKQGIKLPQIGNFPKQGIKLPQIGNKKYPKQGTKKENIKKTIKERRLSKKFKLLYKRRAYLESLPLKDINEFKKKFGITEAQVKNKAEDLLNYCQAHGKRYKNYKAFLRNALKKDFKQQDNDDGYRRI